MATAPSEDGKIGGESKKDNSPSQGSPATQAEEVLSTTHLRAGQIGRWKGDPKTLPQFGKTSSALQNSAKYEQGRMAVELLKHRLLAALVAGTEMAIFSTRKGKGHLEDSFFRLAKNHRNLEYGRLDDSGNFTLTQEVPIALIQSVTNGYQSQKKLKKSDKAPNDCFSLILSTKDDKKKASSAGTGDTEDDNVLCIVPHDPADHALWLDGLKVIVEGVNSICCPENLELVKQLQLIEKEVATIQHERQTYEPPLPPLPGNYNFVNS